MTRCWRNSTFTVINLSVLQLQNANTTQKIPSSAIPIYLESTNSSVFNDSEIKVPKWLDSVFNLDQENHPKPSHEHNETQQQQTTTSQQQNATSQQQTTTSQQQKNEIPSTDDPLNPWLDLQIRETQSTINPDNANNFSLIRDYQHIANVKHELKSESNASLSGEMTHVTAHLSNQKRVLLMAYMRGGSSFLGQMFATNPEAIFWFELVDPMYGAMMGLRIYNNAYEVTHFRNGTRRLVD